MMVIENKFELEQTVYLLTDEDQLARLVTKICIVPGSITYELSQGHLASIHYDFEISDTKNVLTT